MSMAPVAEPGSESKSESKATQPGHLPLPATVAGGRILWPYLVAVVLFHALLPLAFVPWFFSWTGLVLFLVGAPTYGILGITLCYHRLLTHQGLVVPKWLERTFAVFGVCNLQDTPARWVAIHRMHHKHADERPDPHTPLVNFFWSHMGWVIVRHREHSDVRFFEQYARDVLRDPFYLFLERKLAWFWVYCLHALLYFAGGFAAGWLAQGTWQAGVQFGLSLVVWGVFVRTVINWHGTWAVNSVTHLWGYRNYETSDDSRNHWFIGIMAFGEGWHNNHHADQRAAVHGHRWWEFDSTYLVIRLLEALGLAKSVVLPKVWREKNRESPS